MSDPKIEALRNNPEFTALVQEIMKRAERANHPRKRAGGRPPVDNDFVKRYAEHGVTLLQFVQSSDDLCPILEDRLARLCERRAYNLDPDGNSPTRRAISLRYNRRGIFRPIGRVALPFYLSITPNAHHAFHEYPDRILTAFCAQCVREYFRRFYGNPDHERP